MNDKPRSAGILLHITSLPSKFGVGDLGSSAIEFVDFLKRSGQTWWQILPLNPVSAQQGFSPYSSTSAFAGNILLISPELLVKDDLLTYKELSSASVPSNGNTDFEQAAAIKQQLLDIAFKRYLQNKPIDLQNELAEFEKTHDYWIQGFAEYSVLKKTFGEKAWYEWPDLFKYRDKKALADFSRERAGEIMRIKWEQMIFFRQWKQLKKYCHQRQIRLFGDLPFYVAHDSADTWTHPKIFSIDKTGNIESMAGTPPDKFNEEGQLWGMPTFRWDVLKKRKYDWWLKRLSSNLELFDLLRLDHFRAFAAYWEVPGGSADAINGSWKPGPGDNFFNSLMNHFPDMPFVAEDLGKIDQDVFDLRDHFNLPGMNVLHFAFGDNMPVSPYIPHSHNKRSLVYTGTHDNNTTIGWFKQLSPEERRNLNAYTGAFITNENVAETLIRMAYASVGFITILPIQDVLHLDERSRMNTPASAKNNWVWRLTEGQLTDADAEILKEWCMLYNRDQGTMPE